MSEKTKALSGIAEELFDATLQPLRIQDRVVSVANRGGIEFDDLTVLGKVSDHLRRAVLHLDAARLAARELRQ